MAGEEFNNVVLNYEALKKDFKDPVFIGTLLHSLSEERSNTNLILKEINARFDRLEERISNLEVSRPGGPKPPIPMLPEVDENIVDFVAAKGHCTASEVQKKFKYKGANGASARLNSLFKQGLLEKTQVGRKVVFSVRQK
ncbi:MAG: hypothetical protein V1811_01360 [Candidatus Micrarchaeota archaeon]